MTVKAATYEAAIEELFRVEGMPAITHCAQLIATLYGRSRAQVLADAARVA